MPGWKPGWQKEIAMAQVDIGDIELYYREWGDGPPLILIMGFTANCDWWPSEFIQSLSRKYRVFAIDNRGAGRSPAGRKRFTISQGADDLAAFMDALEIPKAHIFGISMGGMIAQAMAIRHRDRIDGLVLGCTMPRPITGFLAGLPGQAKLALSYLFDSKIRARPWIVNIMFSHAFLDENTGMTNEFLAMARKAKITSKGWWRQLRAMIRFSAMPYLKAFDLPTLVISGDCDLLVAPVHSKRLAQFIPNAELVILNGPGHGFVGEMPVDSAGHIIRFLN